MPWRPTWIRRGWRAGPAESGYTPFIVAITPCVILKGEAPRGTEVIKSFRDRRTAAIARGTPSRKLPRDIQRTALKKLRQLEAATNLDDLRIPPGNRLEALRGNREGQHSIRINSQWRICFRFHDGDAHDVEIVDYH